MQSYSAVAVELLPRLESLLLAPSKESRSRLEEAVRANASTKWLQEALDVIRYAVECDVYRGMTLVDRCLGGSVFYDVSDVPAASSCKSLYDHLVNRAIQFVESGARDGLEDIYVLASAVLLLNIFVRVNWMGPPCGILSPSNQHLAAQYRDKVVSDDRDSVLSLDSLYSFANDGTSFSAFALEKVASEFNQRCVLGSPDTRGIDVESDSTAYAGFIRSILDALQIDGEPVYTGIAGAPYFVAALALLSTLGGIDRLTKGDSSASGGTTGATGSDKTTDHQDGMRHCALTTVGVWRGRAAFVWQRIVRNSMVNPCPHLFRSAVSDFSSILKSWKVLPEDFTLSICDPALMNSVTDAANGDDQLMGSLEASGPSNGGTFLQDAIRGFNGSPLECSPEMGSLLILELALRLPYYNMAKLFEHLLSLATSLIGFTFSFTGRLGIRRKYQVRVIPQLVVVAGGSNNGQSRSGRVTRSAVDPPADSSDLAAASGTPTPDAATGNAVEPSSSTSDGDSQENNSSSLSTSERPEDISLSSVNEDTDILERPKLSEESDDAPLSAAEQCILLAKALHMIQTVPEGDELNLEFLNAIVVRCLGSTEGAASWLLSSVALWVRCKTEYHRTKTVERASLQLHKLSDSYYESEATAASRLEFVWHVWSPSSWGIKREIARRLCSIGSFLSAFEIYKKLHMWEDAIQCLIIVGRKNDARELVMNHIKSSPTPLLWCFLGDIEGNISHYKTAWELSKGRCARAQRTLGSYYFNKGDLEAAINALELALAINPMRESSQFLLGCCYLKTGKLDRAVGVFSRVIALNPSSPDAWANMCSAHLNIGNLREASLCIDQAVKHQPGKWEFWDIRMRISLRSRDLQSVCLSIEKLINLGKVSLPLNPAPVIAPQKTLIEPGIVAFLVDSSTRFPSKHATQRMLARTLDCVTKNVTDNADIWKLCARYFACQKFYVEALECTFREYRSIESAIVSSLSEAKADAELQREHDVSQLRRLMDCFGTMITLLKRMPASDRKAKRDTVIQTLQSVRERVRSRIAEVNAQWQSELDSLLESAEVEDVICVYDGE
ncbi:tetratricopeptide repeat containing domain protein, putative [Babesia bigemina]|uniref:Tetratricopeptide repeat containing domain protein, putative n=1 Tax=Babesia bigemina TaxID=5866 RepID=A0A061DCP3_BABBI|nr:tetratricopeptide repeat containing domain protein, putative [Babesia bigemina]CDR95695.1 tetratricopeptide repeat containing domain protein, putative [Babesia bigemina]|eukprot:XP_012767881.1 tetratricopeptide repeat containing domain protein, putative [Babesia bigemina]